MARSFCCAAEAKVSSTQVSNLELILQNCCRNPASTPVQKLNTFLVQQMLQAHNAQRSGNHSSSSLLSSVQPRGYAEFKPHFADVHRSCSDSSRRMCPVCPCSKKVAPPTSMCLIPAETRFSPHIYHHTPTLPHSRKTLDSIHFPCNHHLVIEHTRLFCPCLPPAPADEQLSRAPGFLHSPKHGTSYTPPH